MKRPRPPFAPSGLRLAGTGAEKSQAFPGIPSVPNTCSRPLVNLRVRERASAGIPRREFRSGRIGSPDGRRSSQLRPAGNARDPPPVRRRRERRGKSPRLAASVLRGAEVRGHKYVIRMFPTEHSVADVAIATGNGRDAVLEPRLGIWKNETNVPKPLITAN